MSLDAAMRPDDAWRMVAEEAPQPAIKRAITWRSVGLGLAIALLIVILTPYNDFVVNNSFMVGSFFPPVLTVAMLALVILINGPLHKFAPRMALGAGELAVVLSIALVSCSLPSQGLLRSLLPLPVAPFNFTGTDPVYRGVFEKMDLPPWLFAVESFTSGHRENVVTAFYTRLQAGESIPWHSWLRPVATWGIFSAAFFGAMIALACIVRFQWAVNERLAFPIAQLQAMLIAPPEPGRAFNSVFSSRSFWVALSAVVVIQSSAALHLYFPKVPAIPFSYDLRAQFGEDPWSSMPLWIKTAPIFFTLLGISYFTQTRVSFSLWGTTILVGLIRWPLTRAGGDLPAQAYEMQQTGAALAFLGAVIWIGRHHWAVVWRAIIGRPRSNDAVGFYMRYRPASVILVVCIIVMFAWLLVIGCSVGMALLCMVTILTAHIVTVRVVAETGLAFIRVNIAGDAVIAALPPTALTPRDGFIYGAMHYVFMQGARESPMGFSLNSLQIAEMAEVAPAEKRRLPWLMFISLFIAAAGAIAAALWCYYHYAVPLDDPSVSVINKFGLDIWPKRFLVDLPTSISQGRFPPRQYQPWLHLGFGIAVTLLLQTLSWRYAAWPLLPVGYLMCGTWYMNLAWFSLAIGWLAKVLILRFGGATLFNNCKPFFIGLIFGEAVATGLWLIITLVLASEGVPLQISRFLPQ